MSKIQITISAIRPGGDYDGPDGQVYKTVEMDFLVMYHNLTVEDVYDFLDERELFEIQSIYGATPLEFGGSDDITMTVITDKCNISQTKEFIIKTLTAMQKIAKDPETKRLHKTIAADLKKAVKKVKQKEKSIK